MTIKTLEAPCPVAHEFPFDNQNLTDAQNLIKEAALDIHEFPMEVASISNDCHDKLKARYLPGREPTSQSYILAEHELQSQVRRISTQSLGFRAVYSAMPGIRETLESGVGSGTSSLSAEYSTPFGHTHTGDDARIMNLIAGRIDRITARTLGSFSIEERWALQDNFQEQTRRAATSTMSVLDYKYTHWRSLPAEVKQAPYHHDIEDTSLARLLGKLVHRSYSLETSFYNSVLSGAESGVVMLRHFREALTNAQCPRHLWVPLAYAHAAKLNVPAMMPFWDAKRLHKIGVQGQMEPVFTAESKDGNWQINFVNSRFQKIYDRKRPAGCQGSFALPPQDPLSQAKLEDWHTFMAEKSQGLDMDTNYRQGVTASQMVMIGAIAVADREGYLT